MTLDQLLWATTVAAGNCKCSVPMLVSCDWNGLDCERSDGGAEGSDGGDGSAGGGEMRSGAGCKGYSAPGSEGVACSVLFQTCLLYTSPSPRDKRQSRMPSSA